MYSKVVTYTLTSACLSRGTVSMTHNIRKILDPTFKTLIVSLHEQDIAVEAAIDWSQSKITGLGAVFEHLKLTPNALLTLQVQGQNWVIIPEQAKREHRKTWLQSVSEPKAWERPKPAPSSKTVRIGQINNQWYALDPDDLVCHMLKEFAVGDVACTRNLRGRAVDYGLDPDSLQDAFNCLCDQGYLAHQGQSQYRLLSHPPVKVLPHAGQTV